MGEFFKGWRRKVGLMTLVVACVVAGGWVNSFIFIEQISFSPSRKTDVIVTSRDGAVAFDILTNCDVARDHRLIWSSQPMSFLSAFREMEGFNISFFVSSRQWTCCGLRVGYDEASPAILIDLPYWSLVIPLTLLSAILLVSKPHKSIQQKNAERILVEER